MFLKEPQGICPERKVVKESVQSFDFYQDEEIFSNFSRFSGEDVILCFRWKKRRESQVVDRKTKGHNEN